MLDPIDFGALFMQQAELAAQQAAEAGEQDQA
jgi:preprotein translocase subunit SecB